MYLYPGVIIRREETGRLMEKDGIMIVRVPLHYKRNHG